MNVMNMKNPDTGPGTKERGAKKPERRKGNN
jgi:hypothetical protein